MEETIVKDLQWKENNATHTSALSMVVSLSGQVSVNVRYPVVEEQRHEKENAPTPNLNIKVEHAQVQPKTQRNVAPVPVQLMVDTLHLEHGTNAASHAVVELRSEQEHVPIPFHNTEVSHVWSLVLQ